MVSGILVRHHEITSGHVKQNRAKGLWAKVVVS